jgi:predicted HTH transcriptional regulator
MELSKTIKDEFYDLLKEPTRENFSKYIKSHLGEHNNIDFKEQWIFKAHLAKTIISIANMGGGIIILGIKELDDHSNIPIGIDEFQDAANIYNSIKKYIPNNLIYDIKNFDYTSIDYPELKDKKFQALFIDCNDKDLPYITTSNGDGYEDATIYVRHGTKSEKANNEDLQNLISRRVNTIYSNTAQLKLQEHLDQLETLYKNVKEFHTVYKNNSNIFNLPQNFLKNILGGEREEIKNELYPEEDFEHFILRMINNKKTIVEKTLGLK